MPVIFLWNSQTRRSTPSDLATKLGEQSFHTPPTKYCTIKYQSSQPQTSRICRCEMSGPGAALRKKKKKKVSANIRCNVFFWQEPKCTQCFRVRSRAWVMFYHSLTFYCLVCLIVSNQRRLKNCIPTQRRQSSHCLLTFHELRYSQRINMDALKKNCRNRSEPEPASVPFSCLYPSADNRCWVNVYF